MAVKCVFLVLLPLLVLCFGKEYVSLMNIEDSFLNAEDRSEYNDCDDVLRSGRHKKSGPYSVYLNRTEPVQVYCRFESGKAATSIMQQAYGTYSFERGWNDYEHGFGSYSSGDFWIGLSLIKNLTDTGYHILTVTLMDWNNFVYTIQYNYFVLGPASQRYPLHIGGYVSSRLLPDDFSHNNGMPFATFDRPDVHNCAGNQKAGWWYNYCTLALPTGHHYSYGPYVPSGFYDGIYYSDWHGYDYSLKYIRMDLTQF